MRLRGKAVSIAGAAAMLTALVTGTAGAASGQEATGRALGTFAGWEDPDFSADRWVNVSPGGCGQNRCEIDGWDGDNEISSVRNTTNCTVRMFANDGWTGRTFDVQGGTSIANLETVGFDNEAESFSFLC